MPTEIDQFLQHIKGCSAERAEEIKRRRALKEQEEKLREEEEEERRRWEREEEERRLLEEEDEAERDADRLIWFEEGRILGLKEAQMK
jgi:hypothetical protein